MLFLDNEKTISDSFAISDERVNELNSHLKKVQHDCVTRVIKNKGEALFELSKICRHQNELAYICYMYGSIVSAMDLQMGLGPILSGLGGLGPMRGV